MDVKCKRMIMLMLLVMKSLLMADGRHLANTVSDARTLINLNNNISPIGVAITSDMVKDVAKGNDEHGNAFLAAVTDPIDTGGILVAQALKQAASDSVSASEHTLLNELGMISDVPDNILVHDHGASLDKMELMNVPNEMADLDAAGIVTNGKIEEDGNGVHIHSEHVIHEIVSPKTVKQAKPGLIGTTIHEFKSEDVKAVPSNTVTESGPMLTPGHATTANLGITADVENNIQHDPVPVSGHQIVVDHGAQQSLDGEWGTAFSQVNSDNTNDFDEDSDNIGNGLEQLGKADLPIEPVTAPDTEEVLVNAVTSQQPNTHKVTIAVQRASEANTNTATVSESVNTAVTNAPEVNESIDSGIHGDNDANAIEGNQNGEEDEEDHNQGGQTIEETDIATTISPLTEVTNTTEQPTSVEVPDNVGTNTQGERMPEDVDPLDIFTDGITYQRFPRAMNMSEMRAKVLGRKFKKLYILEEGDKKIFSHVRQLQVIYTLEDDTLYANFLFRFIFSRKCQEIPRFKLGTLAGNQDQALFEKPLSDGKTERIVLFSHQPDDYVYFMSCTDMKVSPYACRDSYYVTLDTTRDPPNQFPWASAAHELNEKMNMTFEDPRFIFNLVLMPCARQ